MKIMAPAGSLDCMKAAIRAGADETYMGISGFGARRFAKNFSVQEYCDAVGEAHRCGTAVNVTLNTIMAQEEFEDLHESLEMLYAAGVDAVIIQDLGFADFLKTHFPDWPRHASTQLSIATPEEAIWVQDQGFSRLVLARELSLEEIESIRRAVTAELEVFASGALCLACSGKCFLSSFIGGRSGNRGMCAQPCRQKYRRIGGTSPASVPASSASAVSPSGLREGFLFSSRDQWQDFPEIARLFAMGVEVIKLEGRMKSPEYVFEVVRYYRRLIDAIQDASPQRLEQVLERVSREPETRPHPGIERLFNRGYSKGYFYEHDPNFINPAFSSSWGVKAGEVRGKKIHLTLPLRHGDGIVFLDRNLQKLSGTNVSRILLARSGEAVAEAPRGTDVELGVPVPQKSVFLFKTYDYELNRQLASEMKLARRRNPVWATLSARVGAPLELELRTEVLGRKFLARCVSEEILASSQKFSASFASLFDALNRFGETPFELKEAHAKIDFDPSVFVPKSVLNQVRQSATEQLEAQLVPGLKRKPVRVGASASPWPKPQLEPPEPVFSAAVTTLAQARACQEAGIRKIYRLEPPVHFGSDLRPASPFGFAPLAGSLFDAVEYAKSGQTFALDWPFHVANPATIAYFRRVFPTAETFFLSPELSEKTVRKLAAFPRMGLVIYGFLYGMLTRKTLFEEPLVQLRNQDGRPIFVTRNQDSENPLELTGSRVYYGLPMDETARLATVPVPGLSELRLDFTLESPDEVRTIVRNVLARGWNQSQSFSYGYEKGIF